MEGTIIRSPDSGFFRFMLSAGHRGRVQPCLLFSFSPSESRLLPFTVTRPVTLPDTSRDTSNNSRLLFLVTIQTTNRIPRRPGPPWKDPDDKRRRTTNPNKKERIPSPRTILQQVFREEAERAVPSDSRKSKISEKVATISGRSKVFQRVWAVRSPLKANEAIEG